MTMLKHILLILLLAAPAFAVEPDEVLSDPVLEHRAREIGKVLRCPVCQGENIDESHAEVSRDLRLLVRERLVAGDQDWEVVNYVTDRYGEYVLFEPEAKGANLILYWLGPIALIVAAIGAFAFIRGRKSAEVTPIGLSAAEQAELDKILQE
jgi:cytochrome c-type biogenesis protein CcmH